MFDQELNVLLVEDDEDDYLLTCELLKEVQSTRFNLHWVTNYDAGLQELRSTSHQVALIDQYFGRCTGVDLVQEAVRAGCVTPMILLTGVGGRDIDFAAMEAGAADYLEKSAG